MFSVCCAVFSIQCALCGKQCLEFTVYVPCKVCAASSFSVVSAQFEMCSVQFAEFS